MAEALVLVDGFDDYGASADAILGGWSGGTIAAGNVAGNCLSMTGVAHTHAFGASEYAHALLHWRTSAAATVGNVCALREGATIHLQLAYNGNGTFTLSRNGVNVGTTPTSANLGIVSNTWYHVEIIARVHDTAGFYDVYINGVLACTGGGSALDTRNGGAGVVDTLALMSNVPTHAFDDVLVYTGSGGTQKGIARVITKFPNADGANTAWTASAGADYTCVDEASQNGDTDYISHATPGGKDTFAYPALGATGTILGVAPTSCARKDDAGVRSLVEVVRSGGADYDGAATKTLTTTYAYHQEIWEKDPATAAAWTVAGAESAEYGVKLTA